MAHRSKNTNRLIILSALVILSLLLAACGDSNDEDVPPPTVANVDDLATGAALLVTPEASPTGAEPSPTTGETLPSKEALVATDIPTTVLTSTPTLPPTVPPPTITPSPDGPALTATAEALAMPITQTFEALQARQQTAAALASPTPSLTPTTSVEATPRTEPTSDGFEIIYYSNRRGSEDIFLLTSDGESRAVTGGATNEREPSCAPDGSAFVYASDASGSWQIYLQRFDSLTAQQLTDSAGLNFAPVYSPDGLTVAYVSTRNNGIPTIWLMNADGSNQRQLTTEIGRDTTPNWGPDGRQLLFAADQSNQWDMFLTTVGTEIDGEFPVLMPEMSTGNELYPLFDSNGERIAYTVWGDLADPQTADIYLLDYELPEPVAVRAMPGADIATGWLDATHLLASVGNPDDVQIASIDITNGESVRLTNDGTFNGGARRCTVSREILAEEAAAVPSPTPSPTQTPTPEPRTLDLPPALVEVAGHPHVVQGGETLLRIGQTYGIDWQIVASINGLNDPNRLSIGQQLTLPVTRVGYLPSGYQYPDSDITGQVAARKEIVVKLEEQRIYAYENGRLVRNVRVSTGLPSTPTVLGEYKIYVKREAQTMSGPGYYLPDVPFVMYFYEGYGLHGTYWHNNFGQPMSHGCVNLPTPEAQWFYTWTEIGTPVTILG